MLRRILGGTEPATTYVPSPAAHEGPLSAEVYHDAARHFLDVQMNTMDSLSNRTAQFLSVASLALPVTYALLRPSAEGESISREAEVFLFGALGAYVFVLVFAAAASMVRALEYRPNSTTLKEHSEGFEGIYLMQWVANEYEASSRENRAVLERKARWIGAEAVAFFVEGLCLSIAAIVILL